MIVSKEFSSVLHCETLAACLQEPGWVVADCRCHLQDPDYGIRQYREAHIPGAVYVGLEEDLSDSSRLDGGRHPLPSPENMIRLYSRLGIGAGKRVVTYDDMEGAQGAARLWWMLRFMGHRQVAVLDGGWQRWRQLGLPLRPGEESNSPGSFQGAPQAHLLASITQVGSAPVLVDSRSPDRYQGKVEPLDRKAGHIPGAINRFWRQNLRGPGGLREAAELRKEFDALLEGSAAQEAVFYCGSGVSACQNILAAVYAGHPQPRLFPGSWSEWCQDDRRPVAVAGAPPA